MAYEFYVKIEGTKIKFKGESPREAYKDKIAGLQFKFEGELPREAESFQLAGKRQYAPVVFVKEIGGASPLIFQAFVTNEVLKKVLFEFIHTTEEGKEEVYYTLTLTDAQICRLKQYTAQEEGAKHAERHDTLELEEIWLVFRGIEVLSKVSNAMASDVSTLKG
jgi:type VI secretion system Hcp family effector